MKKLLLLLLLSLGFIGSANADAKNFSIKINNTLIDVRTPDGFYESSYIDPEISEFVEVLFPQGLYNVHATIVPEDYLEKFDRYIILVSIPEIDEQNVTRRDFAELQSLMREEQYTLMNEVIDDGNKLIENAVTDINSKYDIDMEFSYNETTPLGVFIDTEKAISFNTIMAGNYADSYSEEVILQVASTSFIHIKKRILIAYIYSNFNSSTDVIWLEAKTRELIELLLKSNR